MKKANTNTETVKTYIDKTETARVFERVAQKQAQQQTARSYRSATDRAAVSNAAQTDAQRVGKYVETAADRRAIASAAADRAAAQRAAEAAEIDAALEADKAKHRRKRAFVVYFADGTQKTIETTQTRAQIYITTNAQRVRQIVLSNDDYFEIARYVVYIVLKRGDDYSSGKVFSELRRAPWTDARKQDLVADAYTALIENIDADTETQYKAMFAAVNHTVYKNRAPYDGGINYVYNWDDETIVNVTQTINDYCNRPQTAQRVAWSEYMASLTQKQRDVLRLTAQGLSSRQIAQKYHCSHVAILKHIAAYRRKATPYTTAARSSAAAQQIAQRAAAETDARLTQTAQLLKNAQK